MKVQPPLNADGYKIDHRRQFNPETKLVYNNLTPRKSRVPGVNEVVVFGMQYYCLSTLLDYWNENFFNRQFDELELEFLTEMREYTLDDDFHITIGAAHWKALHELGYLPIRVKSLPEGTLCPVRVPFCTMVNTHPDFFWLPNFLETDMQSETWGLITSATIAKEYRTLFDKYAELTGGDKNFIPFQGHNFSYRGMLGREAAAIVDMGHLTSFVGSDTIPGRLYLKNYYYAGDEGELISCSVYATEHAVMCTSTGFYILKNKLNWERYGEAEFEVFKRLITEVYPKGRVSIVGDTWNIWKVCTEYLPALKEEIMSRDGKVILRPDSGNPVQIMCGIKYQAITDRMDFDGEEGDIVWFDGKFYRAEIQDEEFPFFFREIEDFSVPEMKGIVELLWDIFGGTFTSPGYKVLDSHIGTIYGDGITIERADAICKGLMEKGFASTNWVAGMGSYSYQYVTRDTFGIAHKATYAELELDGVQEGINIFKDPITDDGMKKSAKGLLQVYADDDGVLYCKEECTWEEEHQGLLQVIFEDGKCYNTQTLTEIRQRLLTQTMTMA